MGPRIYRRKATADAQKFAYELLPTAARLDTRVSASTRTHMHHHTPTTQWNGAIRFEPRNLAVDSALLPNPNMPLIQQARQTHLTFQLHGPVHQAQASTHL